MIAKFEPKSMVFTLKYFSFDDILEKIVIFTIRNTTMCWKKVTIFFNLKRTYVLMSFKGKGIDTENKNKNVIQHFIYIMV